MQLTPRPSSFATSASCDVKTVCSNRRYRCSTTCRLPRIGTCKIQSQSSADFFTDDLWEEALFVIIMMMMFCPRSISHFTHSQTNTIRKTCPLDKTSISKHYVSWVASQWVHTTNSAICKACREWKGLRVLFFPGERHQGAYSHSILRALLHGLYSSLLLLCSKKLCANTLNQ